MPELGIMADLVVLASTKGLELTLHNNTVGVSGNKTKKEIVLNYTVLHKAIFMYEYNVL